MTENPAATPEGKAPKLAEKVKFWEEQDRINKELIPRVLKLHALFTQHVEHHQTASDVIAALEARYARRQRVMLVATSAAFVVAISSLTLALSG